MLEEHARELRREKDRVEELLDRTERLLAAVERGIDRMSPRLPAPAALEVASTVPAAVTDGDDARYRAMGHSVAVALPRRVYADGEQPDSKPPVWVASAGGGSNGRESEGKEASLPRS